MHDAAWDARADSGRWIVPVAVALVAVAVGAPLLAAALALGSLRLGTDAPGEGIRVDLQGGVATATTASGTDYVGGPGATVRLTDWEVSATWARSVDGASMCADVLATRTGPGPADPAAGWAGPPGILPTFGGDAQPGVATPGRVCFPHQPGLTMVTWTPIATSGPDEVRWMVTP